MNFDTDFEIPSLKNSFNSAFGGAKKTLRDAGKELKRGKRINIPTYKSKARITNIVKGDRRIAFPDQINAKLGNTSFRLYRLDGNRYEAFRLKKGKQEFLGETAL